MRMKSLFVLLMLCVSLGAGAVDIQDTFFGYKIGCSLNLTQMQRKIGLTQDVFSYVEKASESKFLHLSKAMLGGVRWDDVSVRMLVKGRKFFSIDFSNHFEDEGEAYEFYDLMKERLESKYGEPVVLVNGYGWTGDNRVCVSLEKIYERSNGGDLYWYIILDYFDMDSVVEATSYMDEL